MRLKPSWKEKRRYLLIELEKRKRTKIEKIKKDATKKIKETLLSLVGIIGYAKARPFFIEIKQIEKRLFLIVSVNRKHVSYLRAAIMLSGFRCIFVSGTLKKLKKRIEKITNN